MSKRLLVVLCIFITMVMMITLVACGSSGSSNTAPSGAGSPGTVPSGAGSSGSSNPSPSGSSNATGSSKERSKTLNYAYGQKPTSTDPLMNYNNASQVCWEMHYDALCYTDHSGRGLEPKLALSWEANADFTEYTFHLRDDVDYHNGQHFDADDVVYTYQWLIDHKDESPTYMSYMPDLIYAEKVDQYTVKLGMSAPSPNLSNGLSRTYIVPHEAHKELGQDFNLDKHSYGTGPWILQEWIDGQYTRWIKNPNYWNEDFNSYFDEVYYWHNTEASSIVAAMLSGDISVYAPISGIDIDFKPMFENALDRFEFIQIDTSMNLFLNMRFEDSPFDDINMRKAINYSIDRQLLVDAILRQGHPAVGYWHSSIPGFDPSIDVYRYDLELAKEYIAKSTYHGETLRMMSDAGTGKAEELCLAMADMWSQIGVNVSVAIEDASTSTARRNARDYDITLGNVAIPDALPQRHLTSLLNDTNSHYKNIAANDYLYNQIRKFTMGFTPEARREALFNINHYICDEMAPQIIIANLAATHVQEKGITGVSYHLDGMTNFTWTSYDPALVK